MNISQTPSLALAAVLCLFSHVATAETSVWKIQKGDAHLFLGGTIHVLSAEDYPLPIEFEVAYDQSDLIVLEADVGATNSPAFQQAMLAEMLYTDGGSLEKTLRAETWTALNPYLDSRGIPVIGINPFKPGMVSMVLTISELQRLGMAGTGVDLFYSQRGQQDQKEFDYLESLEEQMRFISNMGAADPDQLIVKTIDDIKRMPEMMVQMKSAWRNGNITQLEAVTLDEFKRNYGQVYDLLLTDRNQQWMPKIAGYLQTGEVEMVLVGALHLAGPDGLLALLEAQGYRVEQLILQ